MRREPNYTILGLVVLALIAMFVGVILFIAGTAQWRRSYQKIVVRFDHTLPLPPLKPGSEVICSGAVVGEVTRVRFEEVRPAPDKRPRLFLVVDAKVDRSLGLRTDCKIRAEGPPLGGQGRLVIVNRGSAAQMLTPQTPLVGLPPTGLNAVIQTLGDRLAAELDESNPKSLLGRIKSQLDPDAADSLVAKIHNIADNLVATANQIRLQLDPQQRETLLAKLDATLTDLQHVTAAFRKEANSQDSDALLGKLHAMLSTLQSASRSAAIILDENRPAVRTTLGNVREATAQIKDRLIPSMVAQMEVDQPGSLMAKFQAAADRINAALENLRRMTSTAQKLLAMNRENLDQTFQNLKETSQHLKAASKEIRRNPWRLLYKPTLAELERLQIVEAARAFSDAAAKLDDALTRLKSYVEAAGPALPPDDPQLKRLREGLIRAFNRLTEAQNAFWEKLASR